MAAGIKQTLIDWLYPGSILRVSSTCFINPLPDKGRAGTI